MEAPGGRPAAENESCCSTPGRPASIWRLTRAARHGGLGAGVHQRNVRRVHLVQVGVARRLDPPDGAGAGVLPERVGAPSGRDERLRRRGVVGHPERELAEPRGVAGAVLPPGHRPVDDRLLARLGDDLAAELGDPRPHGRLAEPVALGTVGVVLDVQHDRRRRAARRAEVLEQVVRLSDGAARTAVAVRDREHVGHHRQPGRLRLGQVREREGVPVVSALGRLDGGELNARLGDFPPVNAGAARVLIAGHVHALHRPRKARPRRIVRDAVLWLTGMAREFAEQLRRVGARDVEMAHPLPVVLGRDCHECPCAEEPPEVAEEPPEVSASAATESAATVTAPTPTLITNSRQSPTRQCPHRQLLESPRA